MKIGQWFKGILVKEPVLTAWLLNGGVAAIFGFFLHWDVTKEAALTTILTGVVGLYTTMRTTPPHVSGFAGVISTMVIAGASFGLHITPKATALLVMALTAVVPLVVRVHVSPKVKTKAVPG